MRFLLAVGRVADQGLGTEKAASLGDRNRIGRQVDPIASPGASQIEAAAQQ